MGRAVEAGGEGKASAGEARVIAIIESWPWWDQIVAFFTLAVVALTPFQIMQKLDRIAKLLERANELEWEKQRKHGDRTRFE